MSDTLRTRNSDTDDVLLVDDDQEAIRLAREAFDSTATGTTLRIAQSTEDALACLQQRGQYADTPLPDLVLLDLDLEGTGGYDLLQTIRTDRELKPLPVIVLTNSTASDDVTRSYEAKANAFLRKPTTQEEFADVVGAIDRFWLQQVKLPPLSR